MVHKENTKSLSTSQLLGTLRESGEASDKITPKEGNSMSTSRKHGACDDLASSGGAATSSSTTRATNEGALTGTRPSGRKSRLTKSLQYAERDVVCSDVESSLSHDSDYDLPVSGPPVLDLADAGTTSARGPSPYEKLSYRQLQQTCKARGFPANRKAKELK